MTNSKKIKEVKEVKPEVQPLSLGRVIAKYRKKAKLTQQQLADKIGVTKAAVYQYEKDKLMPRYNRLQEIVTLLNIPEQDLYGVLLPQAEYTDEEAQEIEKLHDIDISLYSFLWHMGVDAKAYFFTDKQKKHMAVKYNGDTLYFVSNEQRDAFYKEIKDYTVYKLEQMLRDCPTETFYKAPEKPTDPDAQAAYELKYVSRIVNKIFNSSDETE